MVAWLLPNQHTTGSWNQKKQNFHRTARVAQQLEAPIKWVGLPQRPTLRPAGPMARRLTTNQEIAGSIPASVNLFVFFSCFVPRFAQVPSVKIHPWLVLSYHISPQDCFVPRWLFVLDPDIIWRKKVSRLLITPLSPVKMVCWTIDLDWQWALS